MTSQIDPTAPVYGTPTTASVRANFQTAHDEISALQSAIPPASNVPPLINGSATPGSATAWARGDHVHPTDTTRLAVSAASTVAPPMNGAAAPGSASTYSRGDHVHPSDTTRLPLTGGTLSGWISVTGAVYTTLGTSIAGSVPIATYLDTANNTYRVYQNGGDTGYTLIVGVTAVGGGPVPISCAIRGSDGIIFLNYAGGSITWPGTWSDRRLKSNVTPAGDALAALGSIVVVEADITAPLPDAEPRHWDYALIADQVREHIPVAYVERHTDEDFDSINSLPLVAALIRAVQQLTERVVALERGSDPMPLPTTTQPGA